MEKPIYRFLHLVFAVGTVHLLVLLALEIQRTVVLHNETQATNHTRQLLEQRVARLTEEVDAAQTTQYRDAMARRMGYVQKDEVLYPASALRSNPKPAN